MKTLIGTLRHGLVALAAVALVGCETTPRQAELARADGAAIGIQLKGTGALGALSTQTPTQAFFVKLEGDGLISEDLVRSNFERDGRVYLLNAAPGQYAVVASALPQPSPFPHGTPGQAVTFFSRDLVEMTRVMVKPNELAFVGKFEVTLSMAISGGDDVQLHYRRLITPAAPPAGLLKGMLQAMGGDTSTWGSLRSRDQSAAARAEFVKSALGDLAGQGWDAQLGATP